MDTEKRRAAKKAIVTKQLKLAAVVIGATVAIATAGTAIAGLKAAGAKVLTKENLAKLAGQLGKEIEADTGQSAASQGIDTTAAVQEAARKQGLPVESDITLPKVALVLGVVASVGRIGGLW